MCPRSKDITHISILFCAFLRVFKSLTHFLCFLWFPFHCWRFFFALFTSSADVRSHIVQADMLVQYITAAFGSVCDPKWARKLGDLFYPQTHCPWDELAEVKAGAVRLNFFCFSTHTYRASVHNLPSTNSYDKVCTQDIIFSAFFSFIILSSLCQSLQLLFRQTCTFCSIVMSLMRLCSLQKYSWMTSCWHTQSSWPQTSSSRSCFSSILSPHQNHKCQPLQFWKSSYGWP